MEKKRIVVVVEKDEHRELKSALAHEGKTVSEWMRDRMRLYMSKKRQDGRGL